MGNKSHLTLSKKNNFLFIKVDANITTNIYLSINLKHMQAIEKKKFMFIHVLFFFVVTMLYT